MPTELPEDLKRLLNQATMFHPARIWAKASFSYDSRILYRKGVIVGGAYSPFFLQEREGAPKLGWVDPGSTMLSKCRIIMADIVPESANLNEWLGFLQTVAREREGLLIVVDSFLHEDILSTLLINNIKNVVQCVVAKHSKFAGIKRLPTSTLPVLNRLQLPSAISVWVRKDSTIVFQDKADEQAFPQIECAVIEVGGDDANDIRQRLHLLNQAIADMIKIGC